MVSDIKQATNSIWSGEYDAEGRTVRQHFGNGVLRTTTYSDRGLPTEIVDRDSANAVIRAENWDYDESGNVKARTIDGVKVMYKYDQADRLLTSVLASTGATQESFTYSIDDNLLSSASLGAYSYDGAKQPHAVQKIQNTQLAYDDFGRATSLFQGGVQYTEKGVKVSHAHGGLFTLRSAPFAGVLMVLPDGCGSSGSIHCVPEVQFNGLANCIKLKDCEDYIYGPGGLIAVRGPSGSLNYQHTDFLGSLVLATDAHGQSIEKYDYEVFGSRLKQPKRPERSLRVGFAGMFEIAGANMYWTPNRLYDPNIGRFLSPDPQPDDGRASRLGNRYSYARNNPARFRDPLGLQTPGGTVTYDYPWYPTPQSGGGWDLGGTMAPGFGWEKPRYYGDRSVGQIPLTTSSGGSQVSMPMNMSAYNGVLRPENDAIEQSWDFFDVWFAISGIRGLFAGAKSLIAAADYTLDELPDVLIKTEHASGRLADLGFSDKALQFESAIDQDVTQRWLEGLLQEERSQTFTSIQVEGIPVHYRAIIRAGRIEVNSYYDNDG
jgi:RHS repeat-associated protein